MSLISARTAAAKGAALLDDANPGWFTRIYLPSLDMDSCVNCILGQLYGGYSDGLDELGNPSSTANGFAPGDISNDNLTAAWAEEVNYRRDREGSVAATPVVVNQTFSHSKVDAQFLYLAETAGKFSLDRHEVVALLRNLGVTVTDD